MPLWTSTSERGPVLLGGLVGGVRDGHVVGSRFNCGRYVTGIRAKIIIRKVKK